MHDVVRLAPERIPAAGAVLAEALFRDALAVQVFPDDEERRQRQPWQFAALVRYGVLFGEVLANAGDPDGVAVWLPPGQTEMASQRMAAAGLDAARPLRPTVHRHNSGTATGRRAAAGKLGGGSTVAAPGSPGGPGSAGCRSRSGRPARR